MLKKIKIVIMVVLITTSLSGCLVFNNSSTLIDDQSRTKIENQAEEITKQFLEYNAYSSGQKYQYKKLYNLFNQDKTGAVLTINSIAGTEYSKRLDKLYNPQQDSGELKEQAQVFKAQPDSYALSFAYKVTTFDKITQYTASYTAKFKVLEKTDIMKNKILTDNGYIHFTLEKMISGWKINHLKIDFLELGVFNNEGNWKTAK
ncbi:hypothetical protein Halha_2404 [Halobacteroides halobius DSM 5150]|uniref:Lipoprotein n=1 Tax=Halobacteroides halobius (strain ATCC 35273 / DSM 5150 / MD-1) TaxID=748449 RepID=L0KDY8_HALHC|nr:hypothetical protein [Halobacteroides halobius]AGB42278.1 hypothetical protein Halha_2404 [Halobacteroides halobius DSM 5150]